MFGQKKDDTARAMGSQGNDPRQQGGTIVAEPQRAPVPQELNALLGKGSEFDGKLSFEGTVRIDGTFTGDITTSDTLMIGESAKVQAEISCGTVIVNGDVVGNIHATVGVELRRPAKVRGDITTPSLVIEKGVFFEGNSRMEAAAGSNVIPIGASTGGED